MILLFCLNGGADVLMRNFTKCFALFAIFVRAVYVTSLEEMTLLGYSRKFVANIWGKCTTATTVMFVLKINC
jgi:hypothetical protein